MKYNELFIHIKQTKFKDVGLDLNYCVESDDEAKIIRVIFEESTSKMDWFHNFFFFRKVYNGQTSNLIAHSGFANEYKSGNDAVMTEAIAKISEHPDYKIVVTGWSNGGAMAQLAAEDLNYRTRTDKNDPSTGKKPVLITFGAPKVVSGKAAAKYVASCCSKVIEIANINDIVTYCAPLPWFKHINLPFSYRVGGSFNIKKLFDPNTYHTTYDQIDYPVDGPLGCENV